MSSRFSSVSFQYSWIQDSLIYSLTMNANQKHLYVTALVYNVWKKCNSALQAQAESFSNECIHRRILSLCLASLPLLISCGQHLLHVPPFLLFSYLFPLPSIEYFCLCKQCDGMLISIQKLYPIFTKCVCLIEIC